MSNLLSNFFSHINNSQQSRILVIECARSNMILSILNVLQESGYIRGYRLVSRNFVPSSSGSSHVEILLKYKNQKPAINKIIQISKPSKRVYLSVKQLDLERDFSLKSTHKNISSFPNSFTRLPHRPHYHISSVSSSLLFMKGILILSTSRGIMTHWTAYRLNLGGEVLCHVS